VWWFLLFTSAIYCAYVMDFQAAQPISLQTYHNQSLWSWGGSVIETPSDPLYQYHLFVAAFTQHCGLNDWKKNSEVIHAVSKNNPLGPFTFHDIALPVWHHNPQIIQHTDGTYLLFSIGLDPEPNQANCTHLKEADKNKGSPSSSVNPLPEKSPKSSGVAAPVELVQLHYAQSVYGPWTLLVIDGSNNLFSGTNPAPWVNPDGSLYVGSHGGNYFTLSEAPHWKGPYSPAKNVFRSDGEYNIEDPFLWFDSKSKTWKVLLHQYNATNSKNQVSVGGYAESATDDIWGAWTLQSHQTPAYNITVHFQDNTVINYTRRERPKLLLNKDSSPAVLYTGVCYQNSNCYTVSQRVIK